MHVFRCKCGNATTIDPPSKHAGYVVWDYEVDASISVRRNEVQGFLAAITTGQREAWMRYFYGTDSPSKYVSKTDADVIEDIFSKHDAYTNVCYRCDVCGRLYVQTQPNTDGYRIYRPDGE